MVAAPSLTTNELEGDWPARAGVSAGKEFETWQRHLRVFPRFHGVAMVQCIVRVQVGEEEEEGVPAAKEVVRWQCSEGAPIKFC